VKAWPTGTRLLRAARLDDLAALYRWHALTEPARIVAANDNEDDDRNEFDEVIPPNIDTKLEVEPSVNRMAAAWSRCSVTAHLNGVIERAPSDRAAPTFWPAGVMTYRCGDLRFDQRLRLTKFKTGGKWKKAAEEYSDARGPCDGEVVLHLPQSTATAAQEGPSQEDEILREIEGKELRRTLGDDVADVLDWALTSATAEDIAVRLGGTVPGKAAERRGVRLIDDAIKKLRTACPSAAVRAA